MAASPWTDRSTPYLVNLVCGSREFYEDDRRFYDPSPLDALDAIRAELVRRPHDEVLDLAAEQIRNAPLGSWHPATHWSGAWHVAQLLEVIGSPQAVAMLLDQLINGGPLGGYIEEPLGRLRDPQIVPAVEDMLDRLPTIYRRVPEHVFICSLELARILGRQGNPRGPEALLRVVADGTYAGNAVRDLARLLVDAPECFTHAQLVVLAGLPHATVDTEALDDDVAELGLTAEMFAASNRSTVEEIRRRATTLLSAAGSE